MTSQRSGPFLLFLVILLIVLHGTECKTLSSCPALCLCHPVMGEGGEELGYKTDCRGRRLRTIPAGISVNTTELDLGQNYLTAIRSEFVELVNLEILRLDANFIQLLSAGAFRTQKKLEELYLQTNWIGTLSFGVFHGLESLESLQLYNSNIDVVQAGVFDELANIRTIELSYNSLVTLPQELFKDLPNLRSLGLSNNELVSFGDEVFCDLPSLNYLNIRQNNLDSIREESLCNLPSLSSFILLDNPLICDCEVRWLYDFLLAMRLSGPVCGSPQELNGLKLLDLQMEQFCDFPRAMVFVNTSDTVLSKGESILLTCNTTGHPLPTICWTKEEQKVTVNGVDIVQSDDTLLISDVRIGDTGVYHCIASSPAGATTARIRLTVIDLEREMTAVSLTLFPGANVRIPCSIYSSLEDVPVSWTLNDLNINGDKSDKYLILSNGDLYVTDLGLMDTGTYVCTVGSIQINRQLIINDVTRIIEFPVPDCTNQSYVIDSSSSARLTCSATGNPLPTVQWFHNSIPILREGQGSEEGFIVSVVHEILSPSLSDEGTYTCIAQNSFGEVVRDIMLEVRVVATLNSSTIPILSTLGSPLSLPCGSQEESGMPSWERIGGSLPASSVTALDGSLFFGGIMLFDSGTYLCTTGASSIQYNVTVHAIPEIIESVCPPIVFNVPINDTLTLVCGVTAFPPVTVVWYFNGKDIANSFIEADTYEVSSNGTVLLLTNVKEMYKGSYTCLASNLLGNITQSFIVEVTSPPYFLTVPVDVVVNQGESAVFPCSGDGSPTPQVTWWMFQGHVPVQVFTNGRIIVSSDYLVITMANGTDSGRYYCILNSTVDTIKSENVFFNVWTIPILADNLPTKYTVTEGDSIVMLCFADADPVPAVRWFKNGTRLPLPGKHTQDRFGLTVFNATIADEGKYTCRVINVAGMVDLKVFLTVLTFPSVSVTPQLATAFTGCMILLTCLDNNRSPKNFSWFHESAQLMNTSRITVRSNGELLIFDLKPEDTGNYICTVKTELGEDSASTLLQVMEPSGNSSVEQPPQPVPDEAPSIRTLTPRTSSVNPFSNLQLVCLVSGSPVPFVTWTKNGIVIFDGGASDRIEIQDGLLLITEVDNSDEGDYACRAFSSLGSVEETFSITVNVAPSIDNFLEPVTLMSGERVLVECIVRGEPQPVVSWLLNGSSLLVSSDGVRILENNTLVITNATVANSGLYSCHATNVAGNVTSTFPITVHIPDPLLIPPKIIIPPLPQDVLIGDSFSLTCLVSGDPSPNITWIFDGMVLLSSTRVSINTTTINVSSAVVNDTGIYTCSAFNDVGSVSHSVFINVFSDSEPINAPVFTVLPPFQILLSSSENVTIPCLASGQPAPTVRWLRGDEDVNELVNEPRLSVLTDGSLRIVMSMIQDSGTYVCAASNTGGTARIYVDIQVTSDTSPLFRETPEDQTVLTRSSAALECSAVGDPRPQIFWTHNGAAIHGDQMSMLQNGSLIITEVGLRHDGIYSCYATDGRKTVNADATLTVEERKEPPYFIEKPRDMDLFEGEMLMLTCEAAGPGLVEQTWFIDGHQVSNETNVNVVKIESEVQLLITSVSKQDSGSYTCQSENEYGKSEWTAYVHVYSYRSNNSLTHLEGTALLQIACEGASDESDIVHWAKNGQAINNVGSVNVFVINNELWIFNLMIKDSGEYTCDTEGGPLLGVYHLKVLVPSYIEETDTEVTTQASSEISIDCVAHGVPTPKVSWQQGAKRLSIDNKYSLFVNGTLIIHKVSTDDAGLYTCTAENSLATVKMNYNLRVE